MIEVPAAAIILNHLIDHVDFVSIGTNDLVQYLLAVDRNNEKVAHLYTPFHPAVFYTINEIVMTCKKKKKPVCICGEAATNNYLVALFVAMGVKFLSMNSVSIPHVKNFILGLEKKKLDHILKKSLKLDTSDKILEYLEKEFRNSEGNNFKY
jgi:phosphotransferase system enzyme I (PtsP)